MAHLVPSQERQKQRQRDLYKFKAREFQLSQGYIVRLVSERHTEKNRGRGSGPCYAAQFSLEHLGSKDPPASDLKNLRR